MDKCIVNDFLTESMGECCHEFDCIGTGDVDRCIKCNVSELYSTPNTDFFTPNGFFKLWEWSQDQDWWNIFVLNNSLQNPMTSGIINHERFANAVYNHIKGD